MNAPVVFPHAPVFVQGEPAQLVLQQRVERMTVLQPLPASFDTPRFACRLRAPDAAALTTVNWDAAPRCAFSDRALRVGVALTLPAAPAPRWRRPVVRLRALPARAAVEAVLQKASVRPFLHPELHALLTPARARALQQLWDAWAPRHCAFADTELGAALILGAVTVLFLDREELRP
jgi:hypothetical protein